MEPITIVTAFFDIGRGDWTGVKNGYHLPHYLKRTTDTYIQNFARLAKINNPMIVHTTSEFAETCRAIRESHGFGDQTEIVIHDNLFNLFSPLLKRIQSVMDDHFFVSSVTNPAMPEYWNARYVLVNYLKAYFVRHSMSLGSIRTSQTAWIDFGYCRDDDRFEPGFSWTHDFGDKINFFSIRQPTPERSLNDIVHTGDVYLQGCHIVGPTGQWEDLWESVQIQMETLLEQHLIDDDQTMLLMAYLANPDNFKLNKGDPNDWFIIFKDYQ